MSRKKIPNKTTIKAIKDARIGIGNEEIIIDEIIAQKYQMILKMAKRKPMMQKIYLKNLELGIK